MTVEIFGRGYKYTEATTHISASEEQIPALYEEVRLQAEALGYEFEEGTWPHELYAPEIAAYPGTSVVIVEHRDFVVVDVRGHRDHFQ